MNPSERKAFAETIKPAVKGESDKFSWRLYQRVLKNGRERIYIMAHNPITGVHFVPDMEALKACGIQQTNKLMIGDPIQDGWFRGANLRYTCTKGGPVGNFAYGTGFNIKNWLDVTDWFWAEYARKGRCIWNEYFHRWIKINSQSRKCAYCGKHERRTVVTKKVVKRLDVWA